MKSSFKIVTRKVSDGIQVDLSGIFDGSSAWQLVNLIKDHERLNERIVINTDSVREIIPFGKGLLCWLFAVKNIPKKRIVFTGRKCHYLGVEGCVFQEKENRQRCKCNGDCTNCQQKKSMN